MSKPSKKNPQTDPNGRASALGVTGASAVAGPNGADPNEDRSWDELDSGMRAKLPGVRDLASLVPATAARRTDRAFLTAALEALPFFLELRPPMGSQTAAADAKGGVAVGGMTGATAANANANANANTTANANANATSLATTGIFGGAGDKTSGSHAGAGAHGTHGGQGHPALGSTSGGIGVSMSNITIGTNQFLSTNTLNNQTGISAANTTLNATSSSLLNATNAIGSGPGMAFGLGQGHGNAGALAGQSPLVHQVFLNHNAHVPPSSHSVLSHIHSMLPLDHSSNDHRRGILLQSGLADELFTIFTLPEVDFASRIRAASLLEKIGEERLTLSQLKNVNAHARLLQMMKEENVPEELVKSICSLLQVLSVDLEFSALLTATDALPTFLEMIKSLTPSTAYAAKILGNCGLSFQSRQTFREIGGLKSIHNLLIAESMPELWIAASYCIATHGMDATSSEEFGNLGCIRYLVEMLSNPDQPEELLQNVTAALCTLSGNVKNQIRIVRFGAIPKLVSLLASPSLDLQISAAVTLTRVSQQKDGLTTMKACGVFHHCITLLGSESEMLLDTGLKLLRALCVDASVREAIKRTDAIPIITRAIFGENKTIQMTAIQTIGHVIHNHGENRVAFRKQGGVKALMEALAAETRPSKILIILQAIGEMLWEMDSVSVFSKNGGIQSLLSFIENPECRMICLELLRRCSLTAECRDLLKKNSGYETLSRLVKSTEHQLAISAMKLITVCCKEEDHAMEFCRLGVLDYMLQVLMSNATGLYVGAAETRDAIHRHHLSAKYFQTGHIGARDITKTGFYDVGQSTFIQPDDILSSYKSSRRENLYLDTQADLGFVSLVNELKPKLESVKVYTLTVFSLSL
eukprot:TRINITY_DN1605_c0_g1_i1.p1 TRINITY_DN1605_c0_g1~~TRINITY_DN1605_c0_g1_i1.p1  ORF type:complete len:869 (+),score=163.41 TRINITY_DN1605_c0_g1_i1:129-2735(+)